MAGNLRMAELLSEAMDARLLDVHTAIPAVVDRFDDGENTVDATPAVKHVVPALDGGIRSEKMPTINDIPIAWPGSKTCYIKWQIPVGSTVLLIFNEACIAQFRDTGQVSEPGDLARHDLSYPYAIPIRGPKEGPAAVGATFVVEGPEIKLGGAAEELVALASLVKDRLDTIQQTFDAHVHPAPGGATSPTGTLIGPLGDVAASKVKAE